MEGYNSALDAMNRTWDAARMDGLLLLASMTTALGYEGWRGDFRLSPTGHVSRVPERMVSGFAYPGVQIAHPRLFDDPPGEIFSTKCDVGSCYRQGSPVRHPARRRMAACGKPPGTQ